MSQDNLALRLKYNGGNAQNDRIKEHKLKSLLAALKASYQAGKVKKADGRMFTALINPDKQDEDKDNKMVSIPYIHYCLNEDELTETFDTDHLGRHKTLMEPGQILFWIETETKWITYNKRLEELAYFRSDIRRCRHTVDINDITYDIATIFGSSNSVAWTSKNNLEFDGLEYTLLVMITKNAETKEFFKRFQKVEIDNKPWEVQGADHMNLDGVIIAALKEDYDNPIKQAIEKEKEAKKEDVDTLVAHISGNQVVYPYETEAYKIEGATGGTWATNTEKVQIVTFDDSSVSLYFNTGKSAEFELYYSTGTQKIVLPITIDSL